jgi:hypothetical protein
MITFIAALSGISISSGTQTSEKVRPFLAAGVNTSMTNDLYPPEISETAAAPNEESAIDWPTKGTPEYAERWRQSLRQIANLGVPIPVSWFTKT